MAAASTTVSHRGRGARRRGTRRSPIQGSSPTIRRQVAAELFYGPGGATQRAVRELYALIELAEPAVPRASDESSDSEVAFAQPGGRMTLDVLIPTYNRAALLRRTLDSLLAADQPASMPFVVTVCDNRSTDDTAAVVAAYQERFGGRLRYVYEGTPGRSSALNAAIAASSGDLVAMIDDDEEVDRSWLCCIERAFRDPDTDFIGGTFVPRWTSAPPQWLPPGTAR